MYKRALVLLFIASALIKSFAQQKIITSNTIENSIEVKIFMQSIFTKQGINYYRSVDNGKNWVLLNPKPIYLGTIKPLQSAYKEDNSLKDYIAIANGTDPTKDNGLLDLTLIIKSVLSKPYAKYLGIMYEDKAVEKGKAYKYKASTVTSDGKENIIAYSSEIIAADFTKDLPPSEIKIDSFENKIKISWKPEEERYFGVNVYRKGNNIDDFFKVNDIPIIVSRIKKENGELDYPNYFFMEDSLKNNQTYYYKLECIDYFGNLSEFSVVYNTVPKDQTPPEPPIKLDKITKNDTVILTWEYENTDAVGFNVYRSNDDKEYLKINKNILPVYKRDFLLKEQEPGGYYFRVHALDEAGNEGKSSKIFVEVKDLIPPSIVQNIEAKSDTGLVFLNWENNIEKDLWGYLVYRRIENKETDEFVLLNTNPLKQNSFIDTLAINVRNQFEYSIVAIDLAYNKSEYALPVSVRLPDVTPPAQPYIKSIKKGDNTILIEWIPNVDPDLKGYHLFRRQKLDTVNIKRQMNINIIGKDIRRFTDRDFTKGVVYNYNIVAVDTSGNLSRPSEEYSFTYSEKISSGIKFTKLKGTTKKNGTIKLSWSINSDRFKGYVVFRKEEDSIFLPQTGLIKDVSFIDTNIKEGSNYSYKVHVYLIDGSEIVSDEIQMK